MNQEVTAYIEKVDQPWQIDVCNQLRHIILETVPGIEEVIAYSRPHYKKNNEYFCVFAVSKKWVSIMLFRAEGLTNPKRFGALSPNGDRVTAKIEQGKDFDYALLASLLKESAPNF